MLKIGVKMKLIRETAESYRELNDSQPVDLTLVIKKLIELL